MGKSSLCALLVSACASAGANGGDKQDAAVTPPHEDAHFVVQDAPKGVDAHVVDAYVAPDAPPDGGGDGALCTANNECTVPGECCVTLGGPQGFCAPGTVVGSTC